MTTKQFHIGDVLSVTHDRLLSPRHISGVYDILNWMTGDNLYTHQLPRAARECRPYLLKQFPQLVEIDVSSVNKDNWQAWLEATKQKYGEFFDVEKVPADAHERIDPLSELAEKVHPSKIIVVSP